MGNDTEGESEKITDKVWLRLGAVLTAAGAGFAWVVSHFEQVEPVLNSPTMVLFCLFSTYGLGGISTYWLVAKPLERRLGAAEGVIKALRRDEREAMNQMADFRVELAELKTKLNMLQGGGTEQQQNK